MKITGDRPEQAQVHSPNLGKDTTVYSTSDPQNVRGQNGFALDISGTVMDNTAYGGHGRTTEDVMQEAGQQDITARRNYMAIMSNTVSGEDFARLQEEGVHPGDTEVDTVVTIVDHIKAALLQGGTEVAGYTDSLDADQFEEITGDKALAHELARQFKEKDIPATEENKKAAAKAWEKAQEITELSDGAVKYMVENKLPPTIENLYLAQFSGAEDAEKQGRGYYAQDTGSSSSRYYAKKAESFHWESLQSQMEKTITEAGYEVNQETVADSKWLIEKGIPFTPENLTALRQLRTLSLPQTPAEAARAITAALANGQNPLTANVQDSRSNLEKSLDCIAAVAEITPAAIDLTLDEKQPLTIKNLSAVQSQLDRTEDSGQPVPKRATAGKTASAASAVGSATSADNAVETTAGTIISAGTTPEAVTARRQLEEIRLKMTVEVNMRLLRRGFSLDTASLEQLVNQLKEAEQAIGRQLTGAETDEEAVAGLSLYRETVTKATAISAMSAALAGHLTAIDPDDRFTLNQIHESGAALQKAYEKAGESYETVMTAPRKDLGDSIKKAFRNVDDILAESGLDLTESNRRAIRILGYNSMELTAENIAAVKEKDTLLQAVVEKLKPGTVLEMIREKVNPLTMGLEELNQYLSEKETAAAEVQTPAEAMEDYSHFLYKLERQEGITPAERKAYIGVYRLLRQIEKGDSAVVGAMVNAQMEFSMGNLLTAIRSGKRQGRETVIDDNFGGVTAKPAQSDLRSNIAEIMDSLESPPTEEAYAEEQVKAVQTLKNTEDAVIRSLLDHKQPVTWNLLLAAGNMMKHPGRLFRKADEYAKETGKEEDLREAAENLVENFTDAESAGEAYRQLQDTITDIFETAAANEEVKALDVRELSGMCRQISLAATFAREEQYEIPMEINGELTAVNLRIVHSGTTVGKVSVTLPTAEVAAVSCRITGEFTVSNGILTGLVTCSERTGLELLKETGYRLDDTLDSLLNSATAQTMTEIGTISFIQSSKADLSYPAREETPAAASGEETGTVSDRELYLVAKAFIGYLQKLTP